MRFAEAPSGLAIAEIHTSLASARICLQGAQLLQWQPRSATHPVVWMSEDAHVEPGKSPHCGAPICWPWFGAHETIPTLPAHGFARTLPWEVSATAIDADHTVHVTLRLPQKEQTRSHWPHDTALQLTLSVGETLRLTLTTTNNGNTEIEISEAFHTYFQVGDIAQVQVTGLDGTTYADKVMNFARSVQQGGITFAGEVDRVYVDTAAECVIEDPLLRRRIHIAKSGSLSTVVWTPGQDKGRRLGDLGPNGWQHMLCVESANTMENRVRITAGKTHILAVEYRVAPR